MGGDAKGDRKWGRKGGVTWLHKVVVVVEVVVVVVVGRGGGHCGS